jgi:hypothetical protein
VVAASRWRSFSAAPFRSWFRLYRVLLATVRRRSPSGPGSSRLCMRWSPAPLTVFASGSRPLPAGTAAANLCREARRLTPKRRGVRHRAGYAVHRTPDARREREAAALEIQLDRLVAPAGSGYSRASYDSSSGTATTTASRRATLPPPAQPPHRLRRGLRSRRRVPSTAPGSGRILELGEHTDCRLAGAEVVGDPHLVRIGRTPVLHRELSSLPDTAHHPIRANLVAAAKPDSNSTFTTVNPPCSRI